MRVDLPGTIAEYETIRQVGRGGMGVVLLAKHKHLGRLAALKLLSPDRSADPNFESRFMRESQIAASIDHPNILPIYSAGEDRGLLYIAMRFVEGGDLGQVLSDGQPVSPGRALTIIDQIASALDAAHDAGLIHRDVKPENILMAKGVDGSDHCYLSDFGLSKRTDSGSSLTKSGQVLGSIEYISPELALGEPADRRCDIYSLAALAFRLLSGRPLFNRDRQIAILNAHITEKPTRLSEVRADVPADVDAVLLKALAKHPASRYVSAGAFAFALRRAFESEASANARIGRLDVSSGRAYSAGTARLAATWLLAAFFLAFTTAEFISLWLLRWVAFGGVFVAVVLIALSMKILTSRNKESR
jgi:serine/threonine protein kinase